MDEFLKLETRQKVVLLRYGTLRLDSSSSSFVLFSFLLLGMVGLC